MMVPAWALVPWAAGLGAAAGPGAAGGAAAGPGAAAGGAAGRAGAARGRGGRRRGRAAGGGVRRPPSSYAAHCRLVRSDPRRRTLSLCNLLVRLFICPGTHYFCLYYLLLLYRLT